MFEKATFNTFILKYIIRNPFIIAIKRLSKLGLEVYFRKRLYDRAKRYEIGKLSQAT